VVTHSCIGVHAASVTDNPEPPENVRVLTADGRVIPCELVYAGQNDDGIHVWEAVVGTLPIEHGAQLLTDYLPGRTSITVTMR
jgi:hypothetical protein